MTNLNYVSEKMEKSVNVLVENLSLVKVGRANTAILNKVFVMYYGVETPLSQVASISVPEAKSILIQPWDFNILGDIEKAIYKAEIGINPNNDGKSIRLTFPELTEERRKEIVKEIKKMGEESKISIRNIRREAIDEIKVKLKNSEISEDEVRNSEEQIQKITDKINQEIDKMIEKKEKEVLTV